MRNTRHSILLSSLLLSSTLYANPTLCENIGEIVVTSPSNTPQIVDSTTSDLSIITSSEIEERGYTTLTEALNSIGGISYSSYGGIGQTTSLFLNGMRSENTLVLIDGVRVNDITDPAGGAPYGDLILGDIAQIEVIKGAQSGVWGADASAGVINIVTKTPSIGTHGLVDISVGSYGTKRYSATLSHATSDYYIKIGTSYIDTDSFTAILPKGGNPDDYEADGYRNATHSIKAGYNITPTDKIEVTHTIIDAEGRYDAGYDPVTYAPDPDSAGRFKINDTFSSVNYHHTDSFEELDIYAKQSHFEREYPDGWTQKFEGDLKEYGVKSRIGYGQSDFVLVGASFLSSEGKEPIDDTLESSGYFVTNANTFTGFDGKTVVTESIRYDDYSEFDSKVTGKLGIKHFHESIDGLVTAANFGTGYNAPTLFQLYDGLYGNPDLQPETTTSYDISAAYHGFKATWFHNEIEDLFDYDASFRAINIDGTSTIEGFELSYKDEIIENLLFYVAYTSLDATDQNDEKLLRRPEESIKFALDYYGITRLHLGVSGEYVGERKDIDPTTYATIDADSYTLVNFVADYAVTPNLKAYIKVDNLTDEEYQVAQGYATAGQSVYLGVKATF